MRSWPRTVHEKCTRELAFWQSECTWHSSQTTHSEAVVEPSSFALRLLKHVGRFVALRSAAFCQHDSTVSSSVIGQRASPNWSVCDAFTRSEIAEIGEKDQNMHASIMYASPVSSCTRKSKRE